MVLGSVQTLSTLCLSYKRLLTHYYHQGELMKQGHIIKNWKRRNFVLTDGELAYYSGSKMKGMVYMDEVTNVRKVEERRKSIEISTPSRTYTLEADSEADVDEWLLALNETIARKNKKLAGK